MMAGHMAQGQLGDFDETAEWNLHHNPRGSLVFIMSRLFQFSMKFVLNADYLWTRHNVVVIWRL